LAKLPNFCQKKEGFMRQSYYLRQRKNGGTFHVIFFDPLTGKQIDRSTGTNDEKRANAVAQDWLANGLPGKTPTNTT
jgi:hypothetical protein